MGLRRIALVTVFATGAALAAACSGGSGTADPGTVVGGPGPGPDAGPRRDAGPAGPSGSVKALTWHQFTSRGIQTSVAPEAWNAGHLDDVIPLPNGAALVASNTSGVWRVSDTGASLSLSDGWDNVDNPRLARGFYSAEHFFASTWRQVPDNKASLFESSYMTSVTDPWHEVTIPAEITQIHRLTSNVDGRHLLMATDVGLYWASGPAPYVWKLAVVNDAGNPGAATQPFWDVATAYPAGQIIGAGADVVVATSLPPPGAPASFYSGVFTATDLVLTRTPASPALGAAGGPVPYGVTSIAISGGSPDIAYAVSATPAPDMAGNYTLATFWTSRDGGKTWNGSVPPTFAPWPTVNVPTYELSIGVSPTEPQKVAIGWFKLTYSVDSGATWGLVNGGAHDHLDHHRVVFDGGRVYSCSDGGLMSMNADFSSGYVSTYNANLANLQFLAPLGQRQWYGLLAASPITPGLIAGGTQDNGDLIALPGGAWNRFAEGDGSAVTVLGNGQFTFRTVPGPVSTPTSAAMWNPNTKALDPSVVVPVGGNLNGVVGLVTSAVTFPVFHNAAGQAMVGVGGSAVDGTVYGLFSEPDGSKIHWESIGQIPSKGPIYAIASSGGDTILSGAGDGNLYVTKSKDGTTTKATGIPQKPSAGVTQIVALSTFDAAMIWDQYYFNGPNLVTESSFLVTSDGGLTWTRPTLSGLPTKDAAWGMAANQSGSDATFYVSTDDKVFASADKGNTWVSVSDNLPRRPHGADLRVVIENGKKAIYLSTFGRSVFRADLE